MRRTYLMSVASELLRDGEFAAWLETLCNDSETQWRAAVDSAGRLLWNAVRPGLLKDILSPRGTACRCQDGLSLWIFFRFAWTEATPIGSSLSKIGDRLPVEVHE